MKYLQYKPTNKKLLDNVEYPLVMVNAYENVRMANNDLYVWNPNYEDKHVADIDDTFVVVSYSADKPATDAIKKWGNTYNYLAETSYTYDNESCTYRNRIKVNHTLYSIPTYMFNDFNAGTTTSEEGDEIPINYKRVEMPKRYIGTCSYSLSGIATDELNIGNARIVQNAADSAKYINNVRIQTAYSDVSNYAFANASNLETVTINNFTGGVSASIGQSTFENCTKLHEVKLPKNYLLYLYDKSFYNTYALHSIDIPDACKYIGSYAFAHTHNTNLGEDNVGLNTIITPESTNFGNFVFAESYLQNAYNSYGHRLNGTGMYYNCKHLENLSLQSQDYNPYEYNGANYLAYVYIDKDLVDAYAFGDSQCGEVIVEDAENLTDGAFKNANIDYVSVHKNANKIEGAFTNANADRVSIAYSPMRDTASAGVISGFSNYFNYLYMEELHIGVPATYKRNPNDISGAIVPDGYITLRLNDVVQNSGRLTTLELDDTVESLQYGTTSSSAKGVFTDNTALTTVKIGAGLRHGYDCAFVGCDNIKNIIIDSVSTPYLFSKLPNLYKNCTHYELIYSVENTMIPENTASLNAYVLTIRKDVTKLGNSLFKYLASNHNLTTLKYTGTVKEWNSITKEDDWKIGLTNITQVECSDGTVAI